MQVLHRLNGRQSSTSFEDLASAMKSREECTVATTTEAVNRGLKALRAALEVRS